MKKIIITMLLLATVISFIGCGKTQNNTIETTQTVTETTTKKIDITNLVTEVYSYKVGDVEYHLPKINLDGKEIETVNAEIWEKTYEDVAVETFKLAEANYNWCSTIIYKWSVNKNILSLVIISDPSPVEWTDFYVYNIDITTCSTISKNDLLKAYGITREKYDELAKQVLKSELWEEYSGAFSGISQLSDLQKSEYDYNHYLKTISKENIDDTLPYINDKGQLCMAGKVYSPGGADYYWHDLNMVYFVPVDE